MAVRPPETAMRTVPVTLLLLLCAVTPPLTARAQSTSAPTEPPRTWEIEFTRQFMPGANIYLINADENERVIGSSSSLGVGHFFSPHLRVFAAVGSRRQDGTLGADEFQYLPQGRRVTVYEPKGAVFSGNLTWQFRENAFWHPFVSAGVNVGRYNREERQEYETAGSFRVEVLSAADRTEARPVFVAGAKTYFGRGRFYMRPEVAVAIGSAGALRTLVRVGAGFDF